MCKNVFVNSKCTKMLSYVIQVFQNVIQVYIFAHKNKGVQKRGKCSAMYFNLYSTFPSAICYPFHFTWFLLLLSVPRCHSSEHFAMDLKTFQHILAQRGLLQTIGLRGGTYPVRKNGYINDQYMQLRVTRPLHCRAD